MSGEKFIRAALGAAAMAFAAMGTAGAQETDEAPPAEAFAHLPSFRAIDISPDGASFTALVNIDDVYRLGVFEYGGQSLTPLHLISETEKYKARNPVWVRDDRLLFTLVYGDSRYRNETTETRLLSMKPDGSDLKNLFRYADSDHTVQLQDRIVSLLPDDPDHILVEYGWPQVAVYEVDVDDEEGHVIRRHGMPHISHWIADVHGEVRAGSGTVEGEERRIMLRLSDGSWKNVSHRDKGPLETFSVIGVADEPDVFYVLATQETGTDALYAYDAAADELGKPVFAHPSSDIYGIVQDSETGRALGAVFAEEESEIHWLEDTEIQRYLDLLQAQFPDWNVSISSINMPETHAVVRLDHPTNPGYYMLFDMVNKSVFALPDQYPDLAGHRLGKVAGVQYEARDGLEIPAFVTLPPGIEGLEQAQNLPFVIMPHGGPSARDFLGFDYWAQFLATRGYGVLQMNFRGSDGYGAAFREAGTGQWGQAMQDDITDGTQWLIDQGHADPDRVAIMGASYGGYAALMGVVKEPDLYQCAVSFAGVSHLLQFLNENRNYTSSDYWLRVIGGRWSDRGMLNENSPANRAEDIIVPVLLMHGVEDRVVDIDQSQRMARNLNRAGKDVTFIELPAGDHHLSLYENRLRFLQEAERFLEECLEYPAL